VQKRATKLVIAVKHLKYEEKLKQLNLLTLKYRRIRGDMIEVYEIFSGKYDDIHVVSWLIGRHFESSYDLRGHRFSLYQLPIQFDTCKFSFTNRIISAWNSLPD